MQPDPQQPFLIQLLAHHTRPIPMTCRARSGVIVNELRSLLDGVASTLAIRNNKTTNGVYFPIAAKEVEFDTERHLKEKIRKLSPSDQDLIMQSRPFAEDRKGEPGNLLIYGLHQADIKRKHHRLVAQNTESSVGVRNGRIGVMFSNPQPLSDTPQAMAWVSANSSATISFLPSFQYAEPDVLRGLCVVQTLDDFANAVESIINVFL